MLTRYEKEQWHEPVPDSGLHGKPENAAPATTPEQQPPAAPARTRSSMNVTYIEFLYPGLIFAENSSRPVPSRELPAVIPGQATGYRFFTRSEVEVDGEKLVGQPKDYSPWTYFGNEYSADQVHALESDHTRILRDNVRINGWKRVVQTAYGQWYPLNDGDRVVPDADVERDQ
jgi:hypothetical protein